MSTTELIDQMRAGDRRALSRLLSIVEMQDDTSFEVLEKVHPFLGRAFVLGVTGPAGAGKSSMIDQLIKVIRGQGKKVGVIAVDPSSPFSGGAVLGDRVRMQRHSQDAGVFIRSVGSQGQSGGISFGTRALVQLMDAYGCEYIIIETVGAGQSEVEVMNLVSTTLVMLMPEAGDSIQALKAGILEIADIYVVNKKDRPGADRVVNDIQNMLSLVPNVNPWEPPVLLTESLGGEGVLELWDAVLKHQNFLKAHSNKKRELERKWKELFDLAHVKFKKKLNQLKENPTWLNELDGKDANVYRVVDSLLAEVGESLLTNRPNANIGK